jgi:glycine cleavage system H lipoate-binding protein
MKEVNGNLWTETSPRGTLRIGFTQRFIEEKLGECFHVMQADLNKVVRGGPMLVIETNDGLENLKSPVTGSILVFNDRARNFPDRLKEEETILEVLPDGVKLEPVVKAKRVEKAKIAAPAQFDPDRWEPRDVNLDDLFNRPVAPPRRPR